MSQKRGAESQAKNAKPKRARFSDEVQTLEFEKKGDPSVVPFLMLTTIGPPPFMIEASLINPIIKGVPSKMKRLAEEEEDDDCVDRHDEPCAPKPEKPKHSLDSDEEDEDEDGAKKNYTITDEDLHEELDTSVRCLVEFETSIMSVRVFVGGVV